jgi:putative transposase
VRHCYVEWVTEAVASGARRQPACDELGITLLTLQRWTQEDTMKADGRTTTLGPKPVNALSDAERQAILALCNSVAYAHLPPSQIVPRLADEGRYLASERTLYRVPPTSSIAAAAVSVLRTIRRHVNRPGNRGGCWV